MLGVGITSTTEERALEQLLWLKPAVYITCSESKSRESMIKNINMEIPFCLSILRCISILLPDLNKVPRPSEQREVVPVFASWWTYSSWIRLLLSGTYLYFLSLQHDSKELRMLGSFLNFTFYLQLHHFSVPVSGVIASDGESNISAESQPDGQRTFQVQF